MVEKNITKNLPGLWRTDKSVAAAVLLPPAAVVVVIAPSEVCIELFMMKKQQALTKNGVLDGVKSNGVENYMFLNCM